MITYFLNFFLNGLALFIIWYVVVLHGVSLIQMVLALFITPAYIKKARNYEYKLIGSSKNIVPVSILVPAYNEAVTVVDSIKSMLNLNYMNFEVVVVNDGSTDNTLMTVINAFGLRKVTFPVREQLATKRVKGVYYNPDYPRLHLIDKDNGGKSDALNAGINFSRYPYFVSLDADSILDSDALLHIAMAFMQNKYTIAVGGVSRPSNGCTIREGKILDTGLPQNFWALCQVNEFFRSFLTGQTSLNRFNALLAISGVFGAFLKSAVLGVGGYTTNTVGGDMDLIIKLHRYMKAKSYKYSVSYLVNSICWTQVPESFAELFQQRRRWQVGLIDVLGRFKRMMFNPRHGILGILALPYYFFFEMISPLIEFIGYILIPLAWYYNYLSLDGMVLFYTATIGFGLITSAGSLLVEELTDSRFISVRELIKLSLLSIVENVFYRQLVVIFRFMGFIGYGKFRNSWKVSKRQKFGVAEE